MTESLWDDAWVAQDTKQEAEPKCISCQRTGRVPWAPHRCLRGVDLTIVLMQGERQWLTGHWQSLTNIFHTEETEKVVLITVEVKSGKRTRCSGSFFGGGSIKEYHCSLPILLSNQTAISFRCVGAQTFITAHKTQSKQLLLSAFENLL